MSHLQENALHAKVLQAYYDYQKWIDIDNWFVHTARWEYFVTKMVSNNMEFKMTVYQPKLNQTGQGHNEIIMRLSYSCSFMIDRASNLEGGSFYVLE